MRGKSDAEHGWLHACAERVMCTATCAAMQVSEACTEQAGMKLCMH